MWPSYTKSDKLLKTNSRNKSTKDVATTTKLEESKDSKTHQIDSIDSKAKVKAMSDSPKEKESSIHVNEETNELRKDFKRSNNNKFSYSKEEKEKEEKEKKEKEK